MSDAPDAPIQIASFATPFEAEAARALLEENGIDAFVLEDDAGGALPPLGAATGGARLMVRAEDAPAALDLLNQPPV
ncbi:MAG TPA: DUF2007 domain-containing protein [Actinobacteria bacterium]|nr:DUF2007 domain-containing protein [Actinomycetota bacterium]